MLESCLVWVSMLEMALCVLRREAMSTAIILIASRLTVMAESMSCDGRIEGGRSRKMKVDVIENWLS